MFGSGDEEMEMETPCMWHYLADCGRWHPFENDPDDDMFSGEELERYYSRNPKGVVNRTSSSGNSRVDFKAMLQTDPRGRQRRIKRDYAMDKSCSCFTAAPVFWEAVDPTMPCQLVPLTELTPEYKTVAGYVLKEGLLDKPIVSIKRIQNLDLWEFYCTKKKQLKRIHKVKDIEERRLFHGTDVKKIEAICKYNFDLRFAKDSCAYGKGIYFAKYAPLADQYSRSTRDLGSGQTYFYMILARVMIGKSTQGQQRMKKPDEGSLENQHHSCVDSINNPNIFVIFDPNQIYPEYVIEYQKKAL
ncbi:protein mono-ADP-ribosyltransferase PARP11-like [Salarias fasciatus]|nr:protein mono-ADP-ribosyltransferase PARP11-like [Salarias fasciatus]